LDMFTPFVLSWAKLDFSNPNISKSTVEQIDNLDTFIKMGHLKIVDFAYHH
jgi:hypothetical protein